MSDTEDKRHEEVIIRLDALINVLLETAGKNGTPAPMVERIRILHESGMRPVDIAKVLGKKMSYITKELSRIKKEQ